MFVANELAIDIRHSSPINYFTLQLVRYPSIIMHAHLIYYFLKISQQQSMIISSYFLRLYCDVILLTTNLFAGVQNRAQRRALSLSLALSCVSFLFTWLFAHLYSGSARFSSSLRHGRRMTGHLRGLRTISQDSPSIWRRW